MQIEFTDRYGGNPPSWLRGCHGPCEAMGYYPDMKEGVPIDDVEFVACPDCHGTGRVNWLATVARIPRWLWRGVRIVWEFNTNPDLKAPWMTPFGYVALTLKIAFLADLGLWKP